MSNASWTKYSLHFRQPSGTSRGVLREKPSWFIIWNEKGFEMPALGECSVIEGLSPDPIDRMEDKLNEVCSWLNKNQLNRPDLKGFPSIQFGLETLQADIRSKGNKRLYSSPFTFGSSKTLINGLVWMGQPDFMKRQVREKVEAGFTCIKLKIGALDFDKELDLLQWIRSEYASKQLELRVDANGAFAPEDALEKLKRLSEFELHSIEQPIATRQWNHLASLCKKSPIPIALDEELIGVDSIAQKEILLDSIKPQFVVIKPSLVGGIQITHDWIKAANKRGIGWWITSALESNVGLNAITQFTAKLGPEIPQGLGTGGLYTNNIESPLYIQGQNIHFDPQLSWNLRPLMNE